MDIDALQKIHKGIVDFGTNWMAYMAVVAAPGVVIGVFIRLTDPFSAGWSWPEVVVVAFGTTLLFVLVVSLAAIGYRLVRPLNAAQPSASPSATLAEAPGRDVVALRADLAQLAKDLEVAKDELGDVRATADEAKKLLFAAARKERLESYSMSVEASLDAAAQLKARALEEIPSDFREARDLIQGWHETLQQLSAEGGALLGSGGALTPSDEAFQRRQNIPAPGEPEGLSPIAAEAYRRFSAMAKSVDQQAEVLRAKIAAAIAECEADARAIYDP